MNAVVDEGDRAHAPPCLHVHHQCGHASVWQACMPAWQLLACIHRVLYVRAMQILCKPQHHQQHLWMWWPCKPYCRFCADQDASILHTVCLKHQNAAAPDCLPVLKRHQLPSVLTSIAAAVSKAGLERLQPQWHAGQITDKSDMYAFGVVVLEMMTGMQAVDARRPQGCETLPHLLQPALLAVQLMQVCQHATNKRKEKTMLTILLHEKLIVNSSFLLVLS